MYGEIRYVTISNARMQQLIDYRVRKYGDEVASALCTVLDDLQKGKQEDGSYSHSHDDDALQLICHTPYGWVFRAYD